MASATRLVASGQMVALLAFLLATPAAAGTCRELRLGGALALTGAESASGTAVLRGWTLWAERTNARGGLQVPWMGSCSVKLPLDVRDDGSSVTASRQLLQGMLNPASPDFASLDFVIGPVGADSSAGNAAVAEAAERILFSNSDVESLYSSGNNFIFSAMTPRQAQLTTSLETLAALGARSIIFTHENTPWARVVCQGGNETAKRLGMQVLGYVGYDSGKASFADLVFTAKASGADIIASCTSAGGAALSSFLHAAQAFQVVPNAILAMPAPDEQVLSSIGVEGSHGVMSAMQWHEQAAFSDSDGVFGSAQQFGQEYRSRWGSAPPPAAASAAAMGYALQKAIETAGTYDTVAIRQALLGLNVSSFYGLLRFSSSGLVGAGERAMVVTQAKHGATEVVAPNAAATSNIVYPLPSWTERARQLYGCPLGHIETGRDSQGNTICAECLQGSYRDEHSLTCMPCPAGHFSSTSGAASCTPCPAGSHAEASTGSTACVPCPAGSLCAEGSATATPCPVGHYCAAGQLSPATPCPNRTYRDTPGAANVSDCLQCPAGTFNAETGAVTCEPCATGHFSDPGSLACEACAVGQYQGQTGQPNCTACPTSFTTFYSGAQSSFECMCGPGTFWNKRDDICEPCSPATVVICFGGPGLPQVMEGYHGELLGDPTLPAGDPNAFYGLQVFRCPGSALHNAYCIGKTKIGEALGFPVNVKPPNECPEHHHGIACTVCDRGYYWEEDGCSACGIKKHWMFLFGTYLLLGQFIGVYLFSNVQRSQVPGLARAGHVMGLFVFCFQLLALTHWTTSSINMIYLKRSSTAARVMMFDLPVLPHECTGEPKFFLTFLFRAINPLILFLWPGMIWNDIKNYSKIGCIGRLIRKFASPIPGEAAVSAVGSLMLGVFMPVAHFVFSYWSCRSNPSGPDTMWEYPYVICGSQEYRDVLIIAIIALFLYVVSTFVTVFYITLIAPARYRSSEKFRKCMRFVFWKWRPHKYYFTLICITRNLLVALMTVIVSESKHLKVAGYMAILSIYTFFQLAHQPLRDLDANRIENFTYVGVLFAINGFHVYQEVPQPEWEVGFGQQRGGEVMMTICLMLLFCFFAGSLGHALRLWHRGEDELQESAVPQQLADQLVRTGKKLSNTELEQLVKAMGTFPEVDLDKLMHALRTIDPSVDVAKPRPASCLARFFTPPKKLREFGQPLVIPNDSEGEAIHEVLVMPPVMGEPPSSLSAACAATAPQDSASAAALPHLLDPQRQRAVDAQRKEKAQKEAPQVVVHSAEV